MNYCLIVENGYILGFCRSENPLVNAITKEEFDDTMEKYLNTPSAPDGYVYKLRADNLEWEMVKLPEPEPVDEEAELSDYENALSDLGVRFSD